jgi:hypothetical protein
MKTPGIETNSPRKHIRRLLCAIALQCCAFVASAAPSINKYLVDPSTLPSVPLATSAYSNVALPTTNTNYAYVVSVNSLPGTITLTDAFPPDFTVTTCNVYIDGVVQSTSPTGPWGPFNVSLNTTLVCQGSFTVWGQFTNSASAAWVSNLGGPKTTVTAALTSIIGATPPNYNLSVSKSATPTSVPNNGIIHYKIVVTNNSTVSAPLSSLALFWRLLHNANIRADDHVAAFWLAQRFRPGGVAANPHRRFAACRGDDYS